MNMYHFIVKEWNYVNLVGCTSKRFSHFMTLFHKNWCCAMGSSVRWQGMSPLGHLCTSLEHRWLSTLGYYVTEPGQWGLRTLNCKQLPRHSAVTLPPHCLKKKRILSTSPLLCKEPKTGYILGKLWQQVWSPAAVTPCSQFSRAPGRPGWARRGRERGGLSIP